MSSLSKQETLKSSEIPQKNIVLLKKFLMDNKRKKRAALIYGPTGSCKTSSVYALANELNWEVLEINASDCRNKEQLNNIAGNAIKQKSLFYAGKIILVDEVDGIAGNADRGGATELVELISEAKVPIVMTANDPWDKKFSSLRTKSLMIEFEAIESSQIADVLKIICDKNETKYQEEVLKSLARRAGGDLRAAINDLQSLTVNKEIKKESLEFLEGRNRKENIINALFKVLKGTDINVAVGAFNDLDENIDEIFLWLEENIPREYKKPDEIARAYEMLSIADVFRGRIRRQQHWRFLVYISNMLSAGVASAKNEKPKGLVEYQQTTRILKIWKANMTNQKRKNIVHKIAEKTHCSARKTLQSTFPYLKMAIQKGKYSEKLAQELKLEEEEIEWIKK